MGRLLISLADQFIGFCIHLPIHAFKIFPRFIRTVLKKLIPLPLFPTPVKTKIITFHDHPGKQGEVLHLGKMKRV
jgi:hypothetical protein